MKGGGVQKIITVPDQYDVMLYKVITTDPIKRTITELNTFRPTVKTVVFGHCDNIIIDYRKIKLQAIFSPSLFLISSLQLLSIASIHSTCDYFT